LESTQRELMSVLLGRILDLGLISNSTYSQAQDLVHSVMDLPEFFSYPVCLTKEVDSDECT
jgi:hypothetical protein